MTFRGHARRRQQVDPLVRVRGVTSEVAKRLAEVNLHLEEFAAALNQVAQAAQDAQDAVKGGEGDGRAAASGG